jgi:drug/metabolite transporter (DMT)-like permease
MLWYEEVSPTWLLVGAVIMFVSSGITSYANIMMKIDAIQLRDHPHPPFIMARRYVLIALTLYIVGGMADVVSLGLVPLSLRASASCLTIPFNAVFAKITLHESMTFRQSLGAAVTVFASIVAMLFAARQDDNPLGWFNSGHSRVIDQLFSHRVGMFTMITVPLDIVCLFVVWKTLPAAGSHITVPTYRAALHRLIVLASATFATSYQTAWSNLLIKCIAVMAQDTLLDLWLWGLIIALISSALAQMTLMSSIMRLFEAVVVIPPYQIAITVWLVAFSYVVFSEQVHNLTGFVLALLLAFFGILMVALPQRQPSLNQTVEEPLVVERI